jgi:SAM-dependent methyltransferase
LTEIHRDVNSREFWDLTAERFGHDPLAVVIAPTGTKIGNRIRDFFQEMSLAPFLASLQGKLVLEIGCGTGRWLTRARDHGVKIIGLDLSSAMLSLAKVRFGPRR